MFGGGAEVGIVRDEQIAVDVQIISQLRQMRASGNEEAGFDHAADHRFQTGFARGLQRFTSSADAASLHQFHVHGVITLPTAVQVFGREIRFVGHDWQRRAGF